MQKRHSEGLFFLKINNIGFLQTPLQLIVFQRLQLEEEVSFPHDARASLSNQGDTVLNVRLKSCVPKRMIAKHYP